MAYVDAWREWAPEFTVQGIELRIGDGILQPHVSSINYYFHCEVARHDMPHTSQGLPATAHVNILPPVAGGLSS